MTDARSAGVVTDAGGSDETQGRALYRAMANRLSESQVSIARRRAILAPPGTRAETPPSSQPARASSMNPKATP
jgi:hypothetical protein